MESVLYSPSGLSLLFATTTIVLVVTLWRRFLWPGPLRNGLHEPPGPRPLPILGNLLDFPAQDVHLGYARMSNRYGPVMKLETPTSTIVVLSNVEAVTELLEKRGAISSSRPASHMAKLAGWGWSYAIMEYNTEWRVRRRVSQQYLGLHTNLLHADQHARMGLILARRLLEDPQNFIAHLKRASAANIIRTTYGIDVAVDDDPYVKLADDAMQVWGAVTTPGIWAVDWFPILQYLPSWFPGAAFKKFAIESRMYSDNLLNVPFAETRRTMHMGVANACMVSDSLAPDSTEEHITAVRDAAGIMYLAGADTSSSTLQFLFIEMVHRPDVQRAAQAELDRVIGSERLPTLADRSSLPYVEAVVREVFRHYPVAPTGVAHVLEQDDVYEGMLLRKGTILLTNIWAILHDPELYSDPHVFRPERFLREGRLNPTVANPKDHCFGYGRRICPGKHYADEFVFINTAIILACFNIKRSPEDPSESPQSYPVHHALVSEPYPFKCSISPRSDKVSSLIALALDVVE